MTGPALAKKSGPITISKNGSASKAMSPGSPASPINISARSIPPGSPVKAASVAKTSTSVSVKKPLVTSKSPDTKPVTKSTSYVKPETVKTTTTSATKSKPPPLKINVKAAETKEPQSPTILKAVPKTPTTPSVKSIATKSASLVKTPSTSSLSKSPSISSLAAKTPVSKTAVPKSSSVSTAKPLTGSPVKSPSTTKSAATVKSPTAVGTKPSTSSSPVVKLMTVSKPSTPSKTLVSAAKPVASKAPASPISAKTVSSKDTLSKSIVSSSKTVAGVKSPTTIIAKPTTLSRSSSIASSIKSVSVKPLASPSKPLSTATKLVSPVKTATPNKLSTVTKSVTPKTLVKKEASSLSILSVKSSVTVKSTASTRTSTSSPKSPTLKTSTTFMSKTAVASKSQTSQTPSTSVTKITVAPKSPIAKVAPTAVSTTALKSPAVKSTTPAVAKTAATPKSPVAKTAPTAASTTSSKSPVVKSTTPAVAKTAATPKSPIAKTAPTAAVAKTVLPKSPALKVAASTTAKTSVSVKLSVIKKPSSPIAKNAPTRTPSSSSLSKTKSLSSSRLSSMSTESLASRTSLKSPISPKPTSVVKNVAKSTKKVEEPKIKGIRGGQPVKKTIEIPGITELPSTKILENNENILCSKENVENVSEDYLNVVLENSTNNNETMSNEKPTEINLEKNNEILDVIENNLETIEEDSVEPMVATMPSKESSLGSSCNSLDFEVVQIVDCQPRLNNITNTSDNCNIDIVENHFNATNEQVEPESCVIEIEDQFETMNDKLVLGDAPYETDSYKSDASDHEQSNSTESIVIHEETNKEDNVFSFPVDASTKVEVEEICQEESLVEHFMSQKLINQSEGPSSLSTEDSSLISRKSYSEAVLGSTKDGEYYFDYDIDLADDCLDDEYDDEKPVFVEITEKEFPELKPKDLSGKRRMRKQKKRNYSCRTESLSDSNLSTPEAEYNPEDFNGNEFCHYIKMMKDCSFYPNGTFSSDSVKLSTSESLTWLDISVRTTDDDLRPSTESLSTYEVFEASNLSKDFLTSIIGSTTTPTSTENWFWKSIEGRHQTHCRANITLSLQPRPKHLTTPRFMTLLALISEAKGYKIEPSLSIHFITTDCLPRFNDKIKRLMVQGFWLIGRLITESLSEDEEVNCENPFEFTDGDIGYWWAGINMLDWQEYMKNCEKNQPLHNCNQFIVEDMEEYKHFRNEAISSMGTSPEEFMSEADVENFIHTVRNVKYYCDNYFVESQENLEALNESCDSESLVEWENNSE